ncbi:hypothetical protein OAA06_00845 [bacterium]|nr:hypothetical protein [bacterium]
MNKSIWLIWFVFLWSCNEVAVEDTSEPIAQVEDIILTQQDLEKSTPKNLEEHDSIAFVQNYINRWVKTELLLRKAELNLTPEEKDVQQLLDDYRASLLVHKYQQKLLVQNHSPLIKKEEIDAYYDLMKDDFRLREQVVLGIYIKIPKDSTNQSLLRSLYRSDNPEDLEQVIEICNDKAESFEDFLEEWMPISKINENMPNPIPDKSSFLKYNNYFETSDEEYNYYVSFRDYRNEDDVAPISYVAEKIKAILLNKKRIEFIRNLENDLYQEGLKQQIVKFY